MKKIEDLDPVIRRIEEQSEGNVTLDLEGNLLSGSRRWLPWIGRNHYLVSPGDDRRAVARSSIENISVSARPGSGAVEMSLDYELRCPRGNELKTAQSLFDPEASLLEAFSSRVHQWLDEIAADQLPQLLAEEGTARSAVASELEERAADELGLTATFTLKIQGSDRVEQITISIQQVESELKDWDEKIDFDAEVKLGVIPGQELSAYGEPIDVDRERQKLRKVIGAFVSSSVTLHQFQMELKSSVTRRLGERLNERFLARGRQVDRLIIDAEPFSDVRESVDHEVEVQIQPREFPRTIQVESHVLLKLRDTGKYFRAGRPGILGWLDINVEEVVRESLFGLSFEELWEVHGDRKDRIEALLEQRALEIGYQVRQITTITDLEAELLKDAIPIKVEGEFGTRLANYAVGLEIHADATLRSRDLIPKLLTQFKNVRESMEREIQREIERKMRAIDPEAFYMVFEVALDGNDQRLTATGGKPVREYLESKVKQVLLKKFKCIASNISCKQRETELSKFYARLLRVRFSFEREIYFGLGRPALTFAGRFRVFGVYEKGWEDFRRVQPFELTDLERSLADCVAELLREVDFKEAMQATPKQLKELTAEAGLSVRREYGLEIEITFLDKVGLGNKVLTEKGQQLWPLPIETRIENQKQLESGVQALTEERVSLLQQGQGEQAEAVERRIEELELLRKRNLRGASAPQIESGGDKPIVAREEEA